MPLPKRRRGGVKLISEDQLLSALYSEISTQCTAELAVLHLLSRYDLDLDDLCHLLLGLYSSSKPTFRKLTFS